MLGGGNVGGYIGIMEKKMETTGLLGLYRGVMGG